MQDCTTKLNSELTDVKILFCDVYQGIMEIIANPIKHGMEDEGISKCGGISTTQLGKRTDCLRRSGDSNRRTKLGSICHPVSIQKLVSTSVSVSSSYVGCGTYNNSRLDGSPQP
ncbi:hypothetical protein MLD38_025333 [Melastoma candidum]|uniref:Uncharacterized protein n=1 Tax=Melastoma candidum TaxID=119954 RepID=A0ACB9NY50_9MYRT|nr:hypothetical protein MLD38_025333 [Melastoma candidum]